MNAPSEKLSAPVEKIRGYHAELKTIRRDIHAHPELAFQENRTSDLVAKQLESWGIEVHRGLAKTGVVGVIRGRKASAKAIGLRADMDCLPMHETAARPHKSTAGCDRTSGMTSTPRCCWARRATFRGDPEFRRHGVPDLQPAEEELAAAAR
jgi:hypothetical protein